jgi:hypothetical protein
MLPRYKRFLIISVLQLAAVAIGGGVAVAAHQLGSSTAVYAANHCTKYAPTVYIGPECWVTGWMPVNTYQTPSTALRDDNNIYLNAEQWWTLYLFDNFGGTYRYASAYGQQGFTQGVSGIYTKALCASNSIDTYGVCYTHWHD